MPTRIVTAKPPKRRQPAPAPPKEIASGPVVVHSPRGKGRMQAEQDREIDPAVKAFFARMIRPGNSSGEP